MLKLNHLFKGLGLFVLVAITSSCGNLDRPSLPPEKPTGVTAKATLGSTEGNDVSGEVTFIELEHGVRIIAEIEGLTPGGHGFHIHEFGDCSAPDASSAGGHFNPENEIHAGPSDTPRHVGDLGNLFADKNGKAYYDRVDFEVELKGENSVVGKSVIVHEDRDDFVSQPTGNAGARVACGLIIQEES
ncbi:MAG: superoxide dismutase family protein [Chlamydiota bacterium]|nr:superoxide dismutase family protein [Chlamydiota bacterium]